MTDLKSTAGVTADEVLAYVTENYVPIEHLAAETQVSADRILDLIAAECVPPHAYDITGEIVISSAFGAYRQPMTPRRVSTATISMRRRAISRRSACAWSGRSLPSTG